MVIDCDKCELRTVACSDCVVSFLLDVSPAVDLDGEQRQALTVLAGSGLVPPLRLVAGQ
jgi:hypothetical protein